MLKEKVKDVILDLGGGEFLEIEGGAGTGKTQLAILVAMELIKNGLNVAHFTNEMKKTELARRYDQFLDFFDVKQSSVFSNVSIPVKSFLLGADAFDVENPYQFVGSNIDDLEKFDDFVVLDFNMSMGGELESNLSIPFLVTKQGNRSFSGISLLRKNGDGDVIYSINFDKLTDFYE